MPGNLLHHTGLSIDRAIRAKVTRFDERAQECDRGDSCDCFDLEHARIHMAAPLRLIRMAAQVES
jgi:hypothetical protein